jgi:hypothetical protein
MAIKDEMYKMIVQEIDESVKMEKFNLSLDQKKVKDVAKMLTELSMSPQTSSALVNQYMAQIKNICNQ